MTFDSMPPAGPASSIGLLAMVAVAAWWGTEPLQAQSAARAGSPPSEGQRVVLVTGSTGGLGREVARRLAADGDHVIVHGRSAERGAELVREIESQGGTARLYTADFGALAEVRTLAEAVRRDYERLDVLVNNAGIWLEGPRQVSQDGHELHFQVNYLAPYLLTYELLPMLQESAPARVVHVSSLAQRPIEFDDVMLEADYSDGRAYAQSKLAQIMFSIDLAEELEGTGVSTVALHPASMMDTDMVLERGARARSSVHEGADAVVYLVRAAEVESGAYFNQTRQAQANDQAYDAAARARLKQLADRLVGR